MDFKSLKHKLRCAPIPPRILLGRFTFLDDNSLLSQAASDPNYLPFFYYLGRQLEVKNLLEFGFGIGVVSGCFLAGCKTVEHFLTIQELVGFYSPRIGKRNIKQVYKKDACFHVGAAHDEKFINQLKKFHWDMVIFSESKPYDEMLFRLNLAWENMADGGMMVIDRNTGRAVDDFCLIQRREKKVLPTRYKTILITK